MSVFILKIIATVSMIFDHSGYILYHGFSWMNYIGRLAFPIFAFLIAEGYSHTKSLKKYFLRLFLFALLSQIPYMLYTHAIGLDFSLNILFTLLLGLLSIHLYEKASHKWIGVLLFLLCCLIAQYAHFDYGWFGITCIFIFHLFKEKRLWMFVSFELVTFANYLYQYITTNLYQYLIVILCCTLSIIPLALYNGLKGKSAKYFFYIFYPLHLLLLYGLSFLIN